MIFDSLFVFFSIYGFKVFGFIDLSILIPLGIAFIFLNKKNKLPKELLFVFILILTLALYQIVIQFVNGNFEVTAVGRIVRSALNVLIISIYFFSFSSAERLYNLVISVIIFNGCVVIASALYTPISSFLEPLTGNDAWKFLRSSGFASGFDFAGFCNLIALSMLIYYPYKNRFRDLFLGSLILLISSFLISRVTMPFALVLFFLFLLRNLIQGRVGLFGKIGLLLFSGPIILGAAYYLFLILSVTYGFDSVTVPAEVDVVSRFAAQKSGALGWESMFFLPESDINILIGTGAETLGSDVGYIKDIYRFGLLGIFLTFCVYLYVFIVAHNNAQAVATKLLVICIFFTVLLSFKNNYFLSRTSFPILIFILVFSFLSRATSNDKKNIMSIKVQ